MKREQLKEFFQRQYNLLTEQDEEEDLFGDDAGGDDAADGDDEAAEGDEAAEDTGEEGGEEGEAAAEEEEEVVAIEAGDEVRLGKQFDIALDSILQDYEVNALKSAQIHVIAKEEVVEDVVTDSTNEWYSRNLSDLLFEQEEPATVEEEIVSENELDIELFSSDVARLIMNYQTLMDMESIIFNKAKEFLMIKYGEEVAEAFAEILRLRHDLDFDSEIEELEDIEVAAPLAVGAGGGGGGGAV